MNNLHGIFPIGADEAQDYKSLLSAAFNAASIFNGSQSSYDLLMDELIATERFVRQRCGGGVTEDVERHFANCAGLEGAPCTISALLDHASIRAYGRPSRSDDLNDMLAALAESGAVIDVSDEPFVLSDESGPRQMRKISSSATVEIERQPRLAILIRELRTIGIHTGDLLLHVGAVPERTARKLAYGIVDIPRLQKQVAVCDQYGEITFVSRGILPPQVWAGSTKSELKAMKPIDVVAFGANWAGRICRLLTDDEADPDLAALLSASPLPAEPDLGDWRTRAALTVDRVYLSVSETYDATGEPPRADHGIVAYGPLKGLLTWKNIDQEIKDEYRSTRSIAAYLAPSLAKFCDTVGFSSTRGRRTTPIVESGNAGKAADSPQPS